MSTSTTIPITVADEAAARIAELGLESLFVEMLDLLRTQATSLRRIAVEYQPAYDPASVFARLKPMKPEQDEDP